MIRRALTAIPLTAFLLAAGPAAAFTLDMPQGAESTDRSATAGAVSLAVGVEKDGTVPFAEFPGTVLRQSWRVPGSQTTFQLLEPLAAQLEKNGFTIRLRCETTVCGGFDFRFAVEVMPEPGMHIDLGDFRYLMAERKGAGGTEAISLLVSRSETEGFVQVIAVDPAAAAPVVTAPPAEAPAAPTAADTAPPPAPDTLIGRLTSDGHAVLEDLAFDSGSATLDEGAYESLRLLADYLKGNPARKVAVVGHTDAVGSAAANQMLSRKRAASVVDRLVGKYGVPRAQVMSDGVGFLAPRASNLTAAGRDANRRVEVVLLATE